VSDKVWYCENCGYEVNGRGRCHSCGARLIASTLPELESGPDDDEVGYRLDLWDDRTRARLIESLILAGVLHRFEEEELVILAVDEAQVDRLVDVVTGMPLPKRPRMPRANCTTLPKGFATTRLTCRLMQPWVKLRLPCSPSTTCPTWTSTTSLP